MSAYILRRLAQLILLMFVLSFVVYYILSLMPGDPVEMLASSNPNITSEDIERLRSLYGLDKPVIQRYGNWIMDMISGEQVYSRTYRIPVMDLIGPRLWNTFLLSICSLTLSLLLGVTVGVWVSLRAGSRFDYLANLFAFIGISAPSFWLAIVLIILFAVTFPILPAGGTNTVGSEFNFFEALLDRGKYLILPVLSLTFMQTGVFIRFARSSMMEAIPWRNRLCPKLRIQA